MNQDLIKELMSVFPVVGANVPYVELKFRFAGKYGPDVVDATLKELLDQGIMTTYEFGGTNYKLAQEFPIAGSASSSGGNMNKDLSKLLLALADKTGDANIIKMAKDFAANY